MTIVLPPDYTSIDALQKSRVMCISTEEALKEDIRALRIGILNIMPKAEAYEYHLLQPLGRSVMQIEPVLIRLEQHNYSSSDPLHLSKFYVTFKEAVKRTKLDGLIITGAPVEDIPFEKVSYWDEIQRILRYAQKNIPSTLGICWGGLAIAKFIGIEKTLYPKKLFGIFEHFNLNKDHPITGDMDDVFWCPHSRHAGIPDEVMEQEKEKGNINLLVYSKEAGYTIFETTDQRFLVHLGHPEYEPQRLIEEYERDKRLGRTDVEPPLNLNLDNPVNIWRTHRNEFFAEWIKYIHLTTEY